MLSMKGLYSKKAIAILTKIMQVCFIILYNIRELMEKLLYFPTLELFRMQFTQL